ncbi:hypothetical protein [Nocardia sp. NPDC052566]|uniref:hypothetical protein n=1 Tax=Nocardia sp. NPDC052566 TaxID=3364330 RepID=UPI0037C9AA8C
MLDAENGAYERDPNRVWVFTPEVTEGTWGGAGQVQGLADIVGYVLGNKAAGAAYAANVLAERRGTPVPVTA